MKNPLSTVLAIFMLVQACALPTAHVDAFSDPSFPIDQGSNISVFIDEEADLETRKFGWFLANQLEEAGYNLVDVTDSEYILAYAIGEKSGQSEGVTPLTLPNTTYGQIGGVPYSSTSYSTTYIPYSYSWTVMKIWIYAFSSEGMSNGSHKQTVWEGYIGGDMEDYQSDPVLFLRTLVEYLGKDYQGRTQLWYSR